MNFFQTKPNSIFNFTLKPLATSIAIGSILTLTACETNSTSAEQEEHLEPVAVALKAHDESAYRAILFDKIELPDSLDRKSISLKVDETVELDVVTLCISSGVMSPCELSDDDDHDHDEEEHENHDEEEHDDHDEEEHDDHDEEEHDDHDEEEHDDHDEEEHDDHDEEESEFTLKANLSDSSIVELTTEADHFEVSMKGLKAGQTNLEVEIWHGGHADIQNQLFEITVQD
ncbi:hypothetical protein OAU52_00435 [bacterium]|nr:hypothetical protein [bacterium]